MIKIEPYTKEFEKIYWEAVREKISKGTQDFIVSSSKKFIPQDFWTGGPAFRDLILAPFEKLKKAQQYMDDSQIFQVMRNESYVHKAGGDVLNNYYNDLVAAYDRVADSVKDGYSMRVRIVKNSGLTVCPYCNRDYINCRGKNASGAQLDHFFGKLEYPLFSASLYNLVPVCGNCNRIKNSRTVEFASPFDGSIDWEKEVTFSYEPGVGGKTKIVIKSENEAIKNNIEKMRIEEGYQIHDAEIEELLEKKRIYSQTQNQEFQKVLNKINVSEQEIKLAVFGPKITKEAMGTKPLGKMMSDLHKRLGIY